MRITEDYHQPQVSEILISIYLKKYRYYFILLSDCGGKSLFLESQNKSRVS